MGVTRSPLASVGPVVVAADSATSEEEIYEAVPGIAHCKSNPKIPRSAFPWHWHWGYAVLISFVVASLVAVVATGRGQQAGASTLRLSPPRYEEQTRIIDVPRP